MLWRVMDLKALSKTPGYIRRKCFIKRRHGMSVQVIHHQSDLLCFWIMNLKQFPDLVCPVNPSSSFTDRYMPPACQWFCEDEDAAGSISDIFTVLTLRPSRFHRDRCSGFSKKLVWLFIHADDRIQSTILFLIQIQNVFHASNEGGVLFRRNAPAFTEMGLELVFLKAVPRLHGRCCQCTAARPPYRPIISMSIWTIPVVERYS